MASPPLNLPLWKIIYRVAQQMESPSNDLPNLKITLSNMLSNYLSHLNTKYWKCDFYAKDLQLGLSFLKNMDLHLEDLHLVARKVKKAIRYLEMAQTPHWLPEISESFNEELASALNGGNREVLHDFSHRLSEIAQRQVDALFDWGHTNWDLYIIYEILKKCPVSRNRLDLLVTKAFERGAFGSISFPLVLNHFESLSPQIRDRVKTWVDEYIYPKRTDQESFFERLLMWSRKGKWNVVEQLIKSAQFRKLDEEQLLSLISSFDGRTPEKICEAAKGLLSTK